MTGPSDPYPFPLCNLMNQSDWSILAKGLFFEGGGLHIEPVFMSCIFSLFNNSIVLQRTELSKSYLNALRHWHG